MHGDLYADLKALLGFLSRFEKPGVKFAGRPTTTHKNRDGSFSFVPPSYTRDVTDFFAAVDRIADPTYEPGEAARLIESPLGLEGADLTSLRRALTLMMRSERFGEGNWLTWLESGNVVRALRRLRELLATPARTPLPIVVRLTVARERRHASRPDLTLELSRPESGTLTYRNGDGEVSFPLPAPVVQGLAAALFALQIRPVASHADGVPSEGKAIRVDFGGAKYFWLDAAPPEWEPLAAWVRKLTDLATVHQSGVADPTRPFRVLHAALEGGGLDLYAAWRGEGWRYFARGTTMDFDENDDEVWRQWETDSEERIEPLLLDLMPVFFPMQLHPLVAERLFNITAAIAKVKPNLGWPSQGQWEEKTKEARAAVPVAFPPEPMRLDLVGAPRARRAEPEVVAMTFEGQAKTGPLAKKPKAKKKPAKQAPRPKKKGSAKRKS